MIGNVFYSIANKSTNEEVVEILKDLLKIPNLTHKHKRDLNYSIKVSEEGRFPSPVYYAEEGYQSIRKTNSLAELKVLVKEIKEFYHKEFLHEQTIISINEAPTSADFLTRLREIATESEVSIEEKDLELFSPVINDFEDISYSDSGFKIGVSDIDQVTGGFQPGMVASICAFTSHGKSSAAVSSVYLNIKKGMKGVFTSLEVTPRIVSLQFFSRWLYDIHSIIASARALMSKDLEENTLKKVTSLLPDFNEWIKDKLLIVDESVLSKDVITDFKSLNRLYKSYNDYLGTLDFVVYDHINQLDLMFKDLGNTALKTFTSSGKTFLNSNGLPPSTIWCVQTNREGVKRADRRDGKYDLLAISDLNECGASFTPTLVRNSKGETLTFGQVKKAFERGDAMTVQCMDYQSGEIKETTVTDAFITSHVDTSHEWRRLKYPLSGKNMILSPGHKVLVRGEKVSLKDLPSKFKADCVGWDIKGIAREVLIGTLLGDFCISKSDDSTGKHYIRLMQGEAQKQYLDWKVSMIGREFLGEPNLQNNKNPVYVSRSKLFTADATLLSTKTAPYKNINDELLKEITPLSLLVWYLDDGSKVVDRGGSYYVIFSCTNFGEAGVSQMIELLRDKFNLNAKMYKRKDPRSDKPTLQIKLSAPSSRDFLRMVSPLIDVDCIAYKLDDSPKDLIRCTPIKYGLIEEGLEVVQESYYFKPQIKSKKRGKYNFTVANNNHNYILSGGLISANCERSSTYVVFMYTSDDLKLQQETKMTLTKHRLGPVLTEPISVNFNAESVVVGEEFEVATFQDDFSFFEDSADISFNTDDFDDF